MVVEENDGDLIGDGITIAACLKHLRARRDLLRDSPFVSGPRSLKE
jgi:hypothetical protein